jgi:hypothetical protein
LILLRKAKRAPQTTAAVQLVENKVVVQTLVAAAVARPAVVLVVVMRVMELQDMWLMLASTVVVVAADLGSLALVAAVVTEVEVMRGVVVRRQSKMVRRICDNSCRVGRMILDLVEWRVLQVLMELRGHTRTFGKK